MQLREIAFWVLPHPSLRRPHCSRPYILGTPGRAQKALRHVALRVVPILVAYDSTNFFKNAAARRSENCRKLPCTELLK